MLKGGLVSLELHITLSHPPHAESALRAWLLPRALRLTHIELSQGAFPRQTMITARLAGELGDAVLRAHAIRAELAPLGIEIKRLKIEVEHAPEAALLPALYIEHHVKVRTTPDRIAELGPLGAAHGAHLSRNAFRVLDGFEERFLTQRFAAHATTAAAAGLEALLDALRLRAVSVAQIERERVVYDDNLSLDAGWRPEVSP